MRAPFHSIREEDDGYRISLVSEPPPWARTQFDLKKLYPEEKLWEENGTKFDSDIQQITSRGKYRTLYQWRRSSWIPGGTFVTFNDRSPSWHASGQPVYLNHGTSGITVSRDYLDPEAFT